MEGLDSVVSMPLISSFPLKQSIEISYLVVSSLRTKELEVKLVSDLRGK